MFKYVALSVVAASALFAAQAEAGGRCGKGPCGGNFVWATFEKPFEFNSGKRQSWSIARYGCRGGGCVVKAGLLGSEATVRVAAGEQYCYCKGGTRWVTERVYAGGRFTFHDTGQRCTD